MAAVRATLADRELELADFRTQLKTFEGRYLRQVGFLYAELDDWEAKIAELEARLRPSVAASERAHEARKRAEGTREATHGEASRARDFQPSPDLKSLYRETAKRIHPDFAKDESDRQVRTSLMAKANEAYSQGNAEALKRTNETQVLMVRPEAGQAIETRGRLVFQQEGSRKYLAQVWIAGTSLHSEMAVQHKRESESAKNNVTTVELALK